MQAFETQLREALSQATGLPATDLRIENPRDPSMGDLAFPCFVLAKALKQAPPAIAKDLADKLNVELEGIEAVATGPYINFKVDRGLLAKTIIGEIEAQGAAYGHGTEGAGKTIVIDLSSPNIAKPMSVGHLRSTVIGAAIQRIHNALGYKTVGINHIGDWGIQFGKLVVAIDRWGAEIDLEADPIKALLALYVRYHEEEEGDPTLAADAAKNFQELESGVDGHVRKTWKHLAELSLREFDKIYTRLGVTFDEVRGEAFYEPYLESTVERIESAGVTEMSEGALIVDLKPIRKGMAPCLLRKTDGTTLYATRDLAAVFHRHELYDFDRCLYVVGGDQRFHFEQLKGVLKRMDIPWEPKVEHIAFGMMNLPGGKMSTRQGRVVFLEDVLDRAAEEARKIIAGKNPDLANADEVAEQVGVGAVVFNDLKREREKDIQFVWEEVLTFEGETGPYVQYTHARLGSIMRKAQDAGEGNAEADWNALEDAAPLILRLARLPGVLRSAAEHAEPSEVTSWLSTCAREVNAWYTQHRVLGQAPGVTAARLRLVAAAKSALAGGLALLGVAAPEEM